MAPSLASLSAYACLCLQSTPRLPVPFIPLDLYLPHFHRSRAPAHRSLLDGTYAAGLSLLSHAHVSAGRALQRQRWEQSVGEAKGRGRGQKRERSRQQDVR